MAPDPPLSAGEVKINNRVATGASKVGSGWQESVTVVMAAAAEAAAGVAAASWWHHDSGITAAAAVAALWQCSIGSGVSAAVLSS
jgi:hypothetical protein